jgi:hypothetical protein
MEFCLSSITNLLVTMHYWNSGVEKTIYKNLPTKYTITRN